MKFLHLLLLIILLNDSGSAQSVWKNYSMYSQSVGYTYDINIALTQPYDSSIRYSTVYYLDANLNSGMKFVQIIGGMRPESKADSIIFIGIGHPSGYMKMRRRDYIPPLSDEKKAAKNKRKNFGHADHFYDFITIELIPYIDSLYNTNKQRTVIGHSFGGLFVMYCLFREDRMFSQFIALSPSLWTNNYDIFKRERILRSQSESLHASLFFAAGSKEHTNLILHGTRRLYKLLNERKFEGLKFEYEEFEGKNHNTMVSYALLKAFSDCCL
ncbi:Ferri-bacillibactin esterase BesA [bioreactor metagenome]|uniref:Ferri-bacillibactin esterase BesA n=1 Tax=bioreactor metagenome TaxID=1076179 RepID=A0A644X3H6_9ZZZZ